MRGACEGGGKGGMRVAQNQVVIFLVRPEDVTRREALVRRGKLLCGRSARPLTLCHWVYTALLRLYTSTLVRPIFMLHCQHQFSAYSRSGH